MKSIIKYLLITVGWIILCIFPRLLIPLFFISPLLMIYLTLGLINGFMGEERHNDKRKNNRFHLSDDFIAGATVANTIEKINKK